MPRLLRSLYTILPFHLIQSKTAVVCRQVARGYIYIHPIQRLRIVDGNRVS